MSVHFSSKTDEWYTPEDIFNDLDSKHGFTLDVCATKENRKCEKYYDKEVNGLLQDWHLVSQSAWMNPPYGREIGKWMAKAHSESQKGCKVVCLVPARTDTAWWHDYAMRGEVTFLRGRIKFGGCKNSAPFPSAIVVFYAINKKDTTKQQRFVK